MTHPGSYAAIVLAGRRGGEDPFARAQGVKHRALVRVAGEPMLARVLETLRASPRLGSVIVSIDEPELLEGIASIDRARAEGALTLLRAEPSPSASALAALETLPDDARVLVTTADHALLDQPILDHFLSRADERGADVSVGVVSETTLRARFPHSKRTYVAARGERYSGANLFALRMPGARPAAEFWRVAESHRKQPWKLVGTLGPLTLVLFALRRLDLESGFARASRIIGAQLAAIEIPIAEAAVDVDRPADLELVNEVLAGRA